MNGELRWTYRCLSLITWRLFATGCHLINLLASDIFRAPLLTLYANTHRLILNVTSTCHWTKRKNMMKRTEYHFFVLNPHSQPELRSNVDTSHTWLPHVTRGLSFSHFSLLLLLFLLLVC